MTWYIKDLKDYVSELYGEEQRQALSSSLDSIFENQDFARFHYAEVQRLIKEHMEGKNPAYDYVKLMLATDAETLNAEFEFKLAYRANVFALLKNLHSISDFLAHVLYYAFGLNLCKQTFIKPDQLNLYHTKKSLEKIQITDELKALIDSLTNHNDYRYLRDLVNHTKHRSNILSRLTYDSNQVGEDVYQVSFLPFENYGTVAVNEYLHREYDRQSSIVIEIGQHINHAVKSVLTKHLRVIPNA
ncbi:hypothetical protein [Vibrio navarrensis]|uniref:hypothetical protein n=1 Tax=Vibrio navarrensis TaxID=29495 RepID=UPI000A9E194B|nr:hypothetical protein [Vibrio navarrensis]